MERGEEAWEISGRSPTPENKTSLKSDRLYECIDTVTPTLDEHKLFCRRRDGDDRMVMAHRLDCDAALLIGDAAAGGRGVT